MEVTGDSRGPLSLSHHIVARVEGSLSPAFIFNISQMCCVPHGVQGALREGRALGEPQDFSEPLLSPHTCGSAQSGYSLQLFPPLRAGHR